MPKNTYFKIFKKYFLLAIIIGLIGLFFYLDLGKFANFEALKAYRADMLAWRDQHVVQSALIFMGVYIGAVACSIPGAIFLTLTGGFLFGLVKGSLLVITSATIGAFVIFLAAQLAFKDWFLSLVKGRMQDMVTGFQQNAASYLLFLRLVPLFPFWLVNIVPALLGVSKRVFVISTFFGIMPGSIVYVWVGTGLGAILDADKTANLKIIFEPQVLMPLFALGVLALVPVFYRIFQRLFR